MSNELDLSNNINLFNGDCLEVMKGIPDGSIDMILNKEKSWLDFKEYALEGKGFSEGQLDILKDIFYCGWEAFEFSLNDSGLIVSDLNSLRILDENKELLSKYKRDLAVDVGTYVMTPTKSKSMLHSASEVELIDMIEHYKDNLINL